MIYENKLFHWQTRLKFPIFKKEMSLDPDNSSFEKRGLFINYLMWFDFDINKRMMFLKITNVRTKLK